MRLRAAAYPLALLLLWAGTATAQAVPGAAAGLEPGRVHTIIAAIAAPGATADTRYVLEPAGAFPILSGASGAAAWVEHDTVFAAITFSIPASHPAGPAELGRLALESAEGRAVPLTIRVARQHQISLEPVSGAADVALGAASAIGFVVHNAGNVTDTVHVAADLNTSWPMVAPTEGLVLARGDSATIQIVVHAPAETSVDLGAMLRVTAMAAGSAEAEARIRLQVRAPSSIARSPSLPTTVFAGVGPGQVEGDLAPSFAVRSAGRLPNGRSVAFRFSRQGAASSQSAFLNHVSGDSWWAHLGSRSFDLSAGDIFVTSSRLAGNFGSARGLELAARPGAGWTTSLGAARPRDVFGNRTSGRAFTVAAERTLDGQSLRLSAADLERNGEHVQVVSAGYEAEDSDSPHDGAAEVALVRLESGDRSRIAPALLGRYGLTTERVSLGARFRHSPGTLGSLGPGPSQFGLTASVSPVRALTLTAWTSGSERRGLAGDSASRSLAGAIGARYRGAGGTWDLSLRRWQTEFAGGAITTGTTDLELGHQRPIASGADLDLTAGIDWSAAAVGPRPYAGAGVDWQHAAGSMHLAGQWSDNPVSGPQSWVDFGANTAFARARIRAGFTLGSGQDWAIARANTYLSAAIAANQSTEIMAGIEHRPDLAGGSRWLFSVGVSRQLDVPLPFVDYPSVRGRVFVDEDQDGALDVGERAIPGVGLSIGPRHVVTDGAGAFRLEYLDRRPDDDTRVSVDALSLPTGVIVQPGARLELSGGGMIVPLVRTGTIELHLFLDRDGDGLRDATERSGAGSMVLLESADGDVRATLADAEGLARFPDLAPGGYSIRVRVASAFATSEPVVRKIELAPGAITSSQIPLPEFAKEIRLDAPAPSGENPSEPGAELPALPTELLFDFDSAIIRDGARAALAAFARELAACPDAHLRIVGFTDSTGERAYNIALSLRRAEAVARLLAEHGVAPEQVRLEGVGPAEPAASNATLDGRRLNRRVEISYGGPGAEYATRP